MPTLHHCPICDKRLGVCDRHGLWMRHNPRTTYDGWERIHDDNKAEGRPVGAQWDKSGVDYDSGFKLRRWRYG